VIRGFFDGDGCIHIRNNGKSKVFSIYTVSLDFLMQIRNIIERDTKIKMHHYKQDNGHIISVMKANDIENIYHYLYDGALIFMDRKREKFLRTPTP
jgi:intein-encoded DNA endonuclease-like protein